jgi:hypothetical protein
MKLHVPKIILLVFLCAVSSLICNGQTSCTCKPSPPGGTTKCPAGEVAICGADKEGVCEGKCHRVSSGLAPVPYLAALLSDIFIASLADSDLFADRPAAKQCIRDIELADKTHDSVIIKFKSFSRTVSIGLPDLALSKLQSAYEELDRGAETIEKRN